MWKAIHQAVSIDYQEEWVVTMDKISVSVKKSMQCEPADVEGWGRVLYIHAYVHMYAAKPMIITAVVRNCCFAFANRKILLLLVLLLSHFSRVRLCATP